MLSIIVYCFSLARTNRLLLATLTRITGGTSVPSSVSKISRRLLAISGASPLRKVITRTVRSLSLPGVTSSWRSISSAASSAVGVAEITTALRRSSAITRNGGSAGLAASPRVRVRARAACAASLVSNCSTSGAICPARAFFKNTVRTRAASRGPRTSMSRTVFSISSSCCGSAATTMVLLVISGVIVGLMRPGRDAARAATACSIALATVSAVASLSG